MSETILNLFEELKNEERRRVVKDFCFPCGITVTPITEGMDNLKKILYKNKRSQ